MSYIERETLNLTIHPTAVVHPNAVLCEGVSIGPYTVIGEYVEIGEGTRCHSHVNIEGRTTIGKNCEIFPFSSLGTSPQDLKFCGEPSSLLIGDNNCIREHVTMNIGTSHDKGVTQVGSNCLFMVGCHVAHDCVVGDHVIMANNATLAGHVTVGDHAILGGLSAVHQFVRIGQYAMIGGGTGVPSDIIPFAIAKCERAKLAGLNLVGLRRAGIETVKIQQLKKAYQQLFCEQKNAGLSSLAQELQHSYPDNEMVIKLCQFVLEQSKRGLVRPVV